MKNKNILIIIVIFFIFCFIVLFNGLKNSNIYIPKSISKKPLASFVTKKLYSNEEINSEDIFNNF